MLEYILLKTQIIQIPEKGKLNICLTQDTKLEEKSF